MRLALALGVAFGALTMTAEAQPERRNTDRVFVHAMSGGADADEDGWVTRAEATAAAERIFGELDRNDDGQLNDADHRHLADFDIEIDHDEDGEREARDRRDGERIRIIERSEGDRVVRVIRDGEEVDDEDGDVTIIRRGEGGVWRSHGPIPRMPMPPMLALGHSAGFLSVSVNNEEFDRNGDGALSLDEFRGQALRQFEAQDGNGDGRVRQPQPVRLRIEAPTPPEPPTPPRPPRPPRH